ncbi:MAG: hypothetical protein KC656_33225 [Myxococcales bacterium]|nr:hypothetical protein [Myxococcales bacterium]
MEWALLSVLLVASSAGPATLLAGWLLHQQDSGLAAYVALGTVFVGLAGAALGLGLNVVTRWAVTHAWPAIFLTGAATTVVLSTALGLAAAPSGRLELVRDTVIVAFVTLALPSLASTPLWIVLRLRAGHPIVRTLLAPMLGVLSTTLVLIPLLLVPVPFAISPGPVVPGPNWCSPDQPVDGLCPEGCAERCVPSCDVCADCGGRGSCVRPAPGEAVPRHLTVEVPPGYGTGRFLCASGPAPAHLQEGRIVFEVPMDASGPCTLQVDFRGRPRRVVGSDISPTSRHCVVTEAEVHCE